MPLKVELHTHTIDDPTDLIPHTAAELIDRAAELGYDALAITLHDKMFDVALMAAHAARRNVVLIPGVERTIGGRHVLLLNFSKRSETVDSFDALAEIRRTEHGLVIAPHPFFPVGHSIGEEIDQHSDLFDAVEVNAMYVRGLDFNRRAIEWAQRYRKPLVGNGDVHRLAQLGTTYSMVDAAKDPGSICDAIRSGRVTVKTQPLSWFRAAWIFAAMVGSSVISPAPHRERRQEKSSPV